MTNSPCSGSRVAFVLPNLRAGGTQRAVLLIAEGAAQNGSVVDLVVFSREGAFVHEVPPSVRLVDLGGRNGCVTLWPFIKYLRRECPEVVYGALNEANFVVLLAVRASGVGSRIVMSVQNHFGAKWKRIHTPTASIRRWLFREMYGRATAVVAVSEGIASYLSAELSIEAERIRVIPNPVDAEKARVRAAESVDHPWCASERNFPLLVAVGRLEQQKDFLTLLQAMRLVLDNEHARLLILGEGSERKRLTEQIHRLNLTGDVELVGFQHNPYAWMDKADLFVLSSRWEGYPLVILEALALGLPVVSTDCPSGPREISAIAPEVMLCRSGDPEELSRAILLRLKTGRIRIACSSFLDEFAPRTVAKKYLTVLK